MFSEIKTLTKHALVYGVAGFLKKGIGFLMIPVYTHYLSPADYGLIELLDLTLEVIGMIVGFRIGSAMTRYFHKYEEQVDKEAVFTTALIFAAAFSIVLTIILEALSPSISRMVAGDVEHEKAFQIVFLCLCFQNIYLISETYLIVQKKSFLYSSLSILTLVLSLSLNIVFLVVFELGVYGILFSMLIVKFLNLIIVLLITTKNIKFTFSGSKIIEMLKFGLPLIPASFGLFVIHFSDRFFIQKYCSLDDLGLYSLGYKFGMILSSLIASPIFRIWNTQRFEIVKKSNAEEYIARIFTYFCLIIVTSGLCICIFSKEVIMLMAPEKYLGAAKIIPIITLSYVFFAFSGFLTLGYMVSYRTKYLAYVQSFVACLSIILNLAMISQWGVMGAAFSTLCTFFCLALMNFVISQRLYQIPFEYTRVSVLFTLAFGYFCFSLAITSTLFFALALKASLMVLFLSTLWAGGFFTKTEKEKVKELFADAKFRLTSHSSKV